MSSPAFRPVRAASPHLRDLVDGAVDEQGRLVFRSAVLAHLATQSGQWRVRQGENAWEQAGLDGSWGEIPRTVVDGVSWYLLDARWGWRSVLPLPTPRTEAAGPIHSTKSAVAVTRVDDDAPVTASVAAVPSVEDTPTRTRTVPRIHDRPLLRAVTDKTA